MVAPDTQRKVYTTWRATRHNKGSYTDLLLAIKDYREVKELAIRQAELVEISESPLC